MYIVDYRFVSAADVCWTNREGGTTERFFMINYSDMTDPVMSIGTFAKKVDLSVSAIRKYETEGLIITYRTSTGRRLFSREDIDRVRLIQHLINNIGLNMEGIRRLQALLPCWEILPCSLKVQENCPAYRDNSKPCWMIENTKCTKTAETCRKCPVYRLASQCTEDIKNVVYDQDRLLREFRGRRNLEEE